MIDIFSQVVNSLSEALEGVTVTVEFPEQCDSFPLVTVDETNNLQWDGTLDTRDIHSYLVYTINVFTDGDGKVRKNREIRLAIDKVMGEFYGLKRTLNGEIPNIDPLIHRRVMRFEGIINNENSLIIRG